MADFGLSESIDISKEYYRQEMQNAIKLPIKWLAPECISDGLFSERSDVVRYRNIDLYCCLITNTSLSGLMVSHVGRSSVEERLHILECTHLICHISWKLDIAWRNLTMQHAQMICE